VQIGSLVVKALVGGLLVVVFSLIGESVKPRHLAGIASAAPSIALASLAITLLVSGIDKARNLSTGMIAGAVALIAWCLVAGYTVKRFGAFKGAAAATLVWFGIALALWAAILR
jgi:uncharacterized membrane protein (GlpM family)